MLHVIICEATVMIYLKCDSLYIVTTLELFKRSFMHGATTYTDELTQVGHYLAVANQ